MKTLPLIYAAIAPGFASIESRMSGSGKSVIKEGVFNSSEIMGLNGNLSGL